MKITQVFVLFLSLFSFVARADFGLPVGSDIAPLLKCPAVPDAYSKMITELNVLKTSIKQEATCAPLNSEVKGLEELLGDKRTEVKNLIEKSKKETLSDEELAKIRAYVEGVTKKVLSTAELFNRNNHCFIEDKKNLNLSDLASITLDATALVKTIAGPWAIPITLGGQALSSIFQGLGAVVKNRRGYDFTKLDQRKAYVQSLCAYYNYRQDIDYLLYPQKRASQLRSLESKLTAHLKGIVDNCLECSDLAKKTVVSLQEQKPDAKNKATPAELNSIANNIDVAYVNPLGTYTVRTLTILKWINEELEKISLESDENANIGRDFLSEIKADIDGFLFDQEAPNFVNFQATKGYDLFSEFSTFVHNEGYSLISQAVAAGHGKWINPSYLNETEVIKTVASYQEGVRAAGKVSLAARIAQYTQKSVELFERTRLAAGVNETYCTFFQRAGVYTANIQYACESRTANAVRRSLQRQSNNEFVTQPILPTISADAVTDWVESISRSVQQISKDPKRYQKKSDLTRR